MGYTNLITFAILIAVMWFLFIRPQMARQREQAALVASLNPGDRVLTAAGIFGTVAAVRDDEVDVEIAGGVVVTMAKAAVIRRLEPTVPAGSLPEEPLSGGQPADAEEPAPERE